MFGVATCCRDSSIKHWSHNLFLSKFILVLVFDAQVLNLVQLLLLDAFHFQTVILQLLAHLLALLQVVESVLLLHGGVLRDLGANNVSVVTELLLALFLKLALLLLVFLLALNDAQEVVALSLSLRCKSRFTLVELALSSDFELVRLSHLFLFFGDFLAAGLTLTFFEGALGTEGIDLGLTIGGFLLHLAEAGNFLLLLLLETTLLEGLRNLTFNLVLVVLNDLLLLLDLFLLDLGLLGKGDLVGGLDLSNEAHVSLTLFLGGLDFTQALVLNLAGHLLLLLHELLTLLNALNLTLLNLIDNDDGALAASLHTDLLTLLLDLEGL